MVARRRAAAVAGHVGDGRSARAALGDPAPAVRATALGALARLGDLDPATWRRGLRDPTALVRRRACELGAMMGPGSAELVAGGLADSAADVVEAASWALGELGEDAAAEVPALAGVASGHPDALVREAAVAALGAIGDPGGLAAILAATSDKPAVRRRAVLALAGFEGPDVDAALARALEDRDWQVRQAAEDLGAAPPDATGADGAQERLPT